MTYQTDPSLDLYVKAALGKKAFNVVVMDVHKLTSIADVFIICSGSSNRQVSAIAEHIVMELKKDGIRPLSAEGVKEGHWALLDYGHIIIHVFYESIRKFYDLEGLWSDAGRIQTESLINLTSDFNSDDDNLEDEQDINAGEILSKEGVIQSVDLLHEPYHADEENGLRKIISEYNDRAGDHELE